MGYWALQQRNLSERAIVAPLVGMSGMKWQDITSFSKLTQICMLIGSVLYLGVTASIFVIAIRGIVLSISEGIVNNREDIGYLFLAAFFMTWASLKFLQAISRLSVFLLKGIVR